MQLKTHQYKSITLQFHLHGSYRPSLFRTYRVDLINALASFVTLPSDPVAVEVGTDPVEDLTRETIVLPLLGVKFENALIH